MYALQRNFVLASTGLHKSDSHARVERAAVPTRLQRWIASHAETLDAHAAVATVRQGARSHVLVRWPDALSQDAMLEAAVERAVRALRGVVPDADT